MKKLLLITIAIFSISNCYLLDSTGLNLDEEAILGSEAKNKILTYALIGASGNSQKLVLAYISQVFLSNQIRDDRFYDATDVDKCAQDALIINIAAAIPAGTYVCSIKKKEREFFINWPVKINIPFF
jgi:small lipoprotein (TIGR04452 family)